MGLDNLDAPNFGPGPPTYPHLSQIIRIGPPVGGGVYLGYVQQYVPDLTFRDREECYLVEANGVVLLPGYYDARLVGSYNNLPFFVTSCCL